MALNSARATYSFNTAISWQRSSQKTRLRQFASTPRTSTTIEIYEFTPWSKPTTENSNGFSTESNTWQELCRARAQRFSASVESYMFWTSRHLLEDVPDTSDGPEAFSTAPSHDFGRSSLCSESHELVRTPAQTTIFHMRTKFGLRGESQRISTRTVEVTISIALDSYRILTTNISRYPRNRSKCQDVEEIQSEQRIRRIRKHHPSEDRIPPFT